MPSYWSLYLARKQQQLCGPVSYRDFRETGPSSRRWPLNLCILGGCSREVRSIWYVTTSRLITSVFVNHIWTRSRYFQISPLYVRWCKQLTIPGKRISVFKQKRIRADGSTCFLLGEPIMSQPYNSIRKQICSFQLTGRRRILLASIGCLRDWMISLSVVDCGPLKTFQREEKHNYLTQAMFT